MTARVAVSPAVLEWALAESGTDLASMAIGQKVESWIDGSECPTLKQLQQFARTTGVPFGYLLVTDPPQRVLPVPDFREGFDGHPSPSANLLAVIGQSQRRQDWYRQYAIDNGAEPLAFVGSATSMGPGSAAAAIRKALEFEVEQRTGTWADTRKRLLHAFEALGGLSVATSMVDNNNHRMLDPEEFRGFALVDDIAPLVFVNTNQTLNGQLFTLAHEIAHVWRGKSGIGNEDLRVAGQSGVERWCNEVASEVLVPTRDLKAKYSTMADEPLTDALDALARDFRCGTLVVLQSLRRAGLRQDADFDAEYAAELNRLSELSEGRSSGGDHYRNQPFRIGERLSRALISDALEGRTPLREAMRLMAIKTTKNFDEYARRLGVI